jgi:hypothetical protein
MNCRHSRVATIEMIGDVTEKTKHFEYKDGGKVIKSSYVNEHARLRVTFAGKTVDVDVSRSAPNEDGRRASYSQRVWQGSNVLVARIGSTGQKLHPVALAAFECSECGKLALSEALNQYKSYARIVGWREDAHASQIGKWHTH